VVSVEAPKCTAITAGFVVFQTTAQTVEEDRDVDAVGTGIKAGISCARPIEYSFSYLYFFLWNLIQFITFSPYFYKQLFMYSLYFKYKVRHAQLLLIEMCCRHLKIIHNTCHDLC